MGGTLSRIRESLRSCRRRVADWRRSDAFTTPTAKELFRDHQLYLANKHRDEARLQCKSLGEENEQLKYRVDKLLMHAEELTKRIAALECLLDSRNQTIKSLTIQLAAPGRVARSASL